MSKQQNNSPMDRIWEESIKNMSESRSVFFNILTLIEDDYFCNPAKLLEYLEVTREEYHAWETGESDSFMQMLPEIAAFYDVPVEYLLS